MNRRDLVKYGVATAVSAAIPFRGSEASFFLRGGASSVAVAANPIWINVPASGDAYRSGQGLPWFKNRIRESTGWLDTSTGKNILPSQMTNGWPNTTAFKVSLFSNTSLPSWTTGTFKCGFTLNTSTDTPTVSAYGNTTVSNFVQSGATCTFDLAITGPTTPGFEVSGMTNGCTDIFAYLPAYPASSIDDPTNVNSLTTEAINHYKLFGGFRWMWMGNAAFMSAQGTATNRNSATNTQAQQGWASDGDAAVTFATLPGSGARTATLSAGWPQKTGTYGLAWYNGTNYTWRICACTNGSTGISWSNALSSAEAATSTTINYGLEGYPIEWAVTMANATNGSLRICLPWLDDGTDYQAGSYTQAVMNYVKSNWTSTGWVEFELGNENWNSGYYTYDLKLALQKLYSTTYTTTWEVQAAWQAAIASMGRTTFGGNWGTKYRLVYCDQAGNAVNFWDQLSIYSSYGTITSDFSEINAAPYCNPTVGNSDSVATIESESTTAAETFTMTSLGCEQVSIIGMHFGLPAGTYEGGFQWNSSAYSSVANLGAAIMDSGYQSCVATLLGSVFNAGFLKHIHFEGGVDPSTAATAPVDQLTTSYTNLATAPTLLALEEYMPPNSISITRNVITSPGTVIQGYNYMDNQSAISTTAPNLGQKLGPNPSNYGVAYLLYSATARTVSLSANFTNGGASAGSTELEYGNAANGYAILGGISTPTSISIPTGTNTVSIGSFPVIKGWNYIVLGTPGTNQSSITINSATAA